MAIVAVLFEPTEIETCQASSLRRVRQAEALQLAAAAQFGKDHAGGTDRLSPRCEFFVRLMSNPVVTTPFGRRGPAVGDSHNRTHDTAEEALGGGFGLQDQGALAVDAFAEAGDLPRAGFQVDGAAGEHGKCLPALP
jgi:hypothetical protein